MTRQELPKNISLSAPFHDRAGYGLANVCAALQAGVTTFDAAVGGLGGCPYAPGAPGNLSTETLVEYLEAMGLTTAGGSREWVGLRLWVRSAGTRERVVPC